MSADRGESCKAGSDHGSFVRTVELFYADKMLALKSLLKAKKDLHAEQAEHQTAEDEVERLRQITALFKRVTLSHDEIIRTVRRRLNEAQDEIDSQRGVTEDLKQQVDNLTRNLDLAEHDRDRACDLNWRLNLALRLSGDNSGHPEAAAEQQINELNSHLAFAKHDRDRAWEQVNTLAEKLEVVGRRNVELEEQNDLAGGIIANAYGGDWEQAHTDWREAATRWRATYIADCRTVLTEHLDRTLRPPLNPEKGDD